ncbi:MAG TPA: DUF983 domain-containing protein [Caulobacteraceae bacterium]|jgi:uncharacterized protein (DUF983 family)|nr:DUF983 domain-containing protein [Caulobacteraceae bacterium]
MPAMLPTAEFQLPASPLLRSVWRGVRQRCPACGEGSLFYRYLKVSPQCPRCGHDLDQYPSDDGPAYFTILLVGHVVVLPLLLFDFIWKAPAVVVVPAVLIPLAVFTLLALPRVKGAVIGVLYTLRVKRQDAALHTADRLE